MAIDAYSLCPGGTGKKIKFCCPDFLPELEKIDRMVSGEQYIAAIEHIHHLHGQAANQDRACLLAIKGMLLRVTGQLEQAQANAESFAAKHPQNALAHAELAIVTALDVGGAAAMPHLQQAIAMSADAIPGRVFEACGVLAEVLLADGHWLAGRALLTLQMAIDHDNPQPLSLLVEFNRSPQVSLLFKDDPIWPAPPAEASWRQPYQEAMFDVGKARWQSALEKLAAIQEDASESPVFWRSLANVRGWLADNDGCAAALTKYASLEVPLDDAVEAQAMAMTLSKDALGDAIDILSAAWTVDNCDQFQERLLSDRRVLGVPADAFASEEGPAPRGAYLLLDRPMIESGSDLTVDGIPNILAQAVLYGRQTDREARFEAYAVTREDLPRLQVMVGEIGSGTLGAECESEVIARVSQTSDMLRPKWHLPHDMSRAAVKALSEQYHREAILTRWPAMKLGEFDGRSAADVASLPEYRVKLLAAIQLLESWSDQAGVRFDFDELRGKLGLPKCEPIDPREIAVDRLPLVRLPRVIASLLTDEALIAVFRRASVYNISEVLAKLAKELVSRPSLAGRDECLRAYSALARTSETPEEAIAYVNQGRKAAEAAGQSSASWDLMELSFNFGAQNGHEAVRLITHIQQEHLQEPGVHEMLMQLMIEVGILRPDGTPNIPTSGRGPRLGEQPMAAEPGGLWTPDSQKPASGGGGKLWVPD